MGSAGKKSEWKLGNFMGSFFKALLFVNIEWFHGARSLLVNIFIFCRVSSIRTLTLGWRDLLHGTVRRIWGCLGHIETIFCLKIVTNVSVGASRVHIIFFISLQELLKQFNSIVLVFMLMKQLSCRISMFYIQLIVIHAVI